MQLSYLWSWWVLKTGMHGVSDPASQNQCIGEREVLPPWTVTSSEQLIR